MPIAQIGITPCKSIVRQCRATVRRRRAMVLRRRTMVLQQQISGTVEQVSSCSTAETHRTATKVVVSDACDQDDDAYAVIRRAEQSRR